METKTVNKVLGYLLLLAGIGIIAFSAFNVYSVFKGQAQPYPLFKFDAIALDFSNMVDGAPPEAKANMRQELVSSNLLNEPTNMIAHLLLMGFVLTVGFKVAQIGVYLVRTIKVNVKEEKPSILTPKQ